MKARDVMASPVISVKPSASVREVAETFLKYRISAVPVVDDRAASSASSARAISCTGPRPAPSGDAPGGSSR